MPVFFAHGSGSDFYRLYKNPKETPKNLLEIFR